MLHAPSLFRALPLYPQLRKHRCTAVNRRFGPILLQKDFRHLCEKKYSKPGHPRAFLIQQIASFTFIAPHSRARGADDGGRRRRDAS